MRTRKRVGGKEKGRGPVGFIPHQFHAHVHTSHGHDVPAHLGCLGASAVDFQSVVCWTPGLLREWGDSGDVMQTARAPLGAAAWTSSLWGCGED